MIVGNHEIRVVDATTTTMCTLLYLPTALTCVSLHFRLMVDNEAHCPQADRSVTMGRRAAIILFQHLACASQFRYETIPSKLSRSILATDLPLLLSPLLPSSVLGGGGGFLQVEVKVSPGEMLEVIVGGGGYGSHGEAGGAGGFNGGQAGR